jgi:hypothetical protein
MAELINNIADLFTIIGGVGGLLLIFMRLGGMRTDLRSTLSKLRRTDRRHDEWLRDHELRITTIERRDST